MAWNHMPRQQQRGSQMQDGAPKEAVEGRSGNQAKYADEQLTGAPVQGVDLPATNPPEREGDITPTLPDDDPVNWDDVVQPENHSRQVAPSGEEAGAAPEDSGDDEPLPEGK